jgi:hypothetical protein
MPLGKNATPGPKPTKQAPAFSALTGVNPDLEAYAGLPRSEA